jgi:hypothetical protein
VKTRSTGRDATPPAPAYGIARAPSFVDLDGPEWLRRRLENVRRRLDLPDLGAAIVIEDKVVAASVVGVRK